MLVGVAGGPVPVLFLFSSALVCQGVMWLALLSLCFLVLGWYKHPFFGLNSIFKLKSTFLDLSEKVSVLLMTNPLYESTP